MCVCVFNPLPPPHRYLKEVGFSDTVLEARVSRINAYRTLYSQNQIEPSHTTAMVSQCVCVCVRERERERERGRGRDMG